MVAFDAADLVDLGRLCLTPLSVYLVVVQIIASKGEVGATPGGLRFFSSLKRDFKAGCDTQLLTGCCEADPGAPCVSHLSSPYSGLPSPSSWVSLWAAA